MQGYFISEKKAKELGFMDNPKFVENTQKTIIVLTEEDIKEEGCHFDKEEANIFMNWFYANYYNSIIESYNNQ